MTNEEREKTIATAIDVFEYQIERSEDVKCHKCDECGENPFEDYCIKDVAKWLRLALEALKQEPCEDVINRKELVEWLENIQPIDGKELGVLFDVREYVKKMPPVTSAREHGEWERGYSYPDGQYVKCSECGEIIKCIYPMWFCPNCGADMRGAKIPHTDKSGLEYADQPALRSAT